MVENDEEHLHDVPNEEHAHVHEAPQGHAHSVHEAHEGHAHEQHAEHTHAEHGGHPHGHGRGKYAAYKPSPTHMNYALAAALIIVLVAAFIAISGLSRSLNDLNTLGNNTNGTGNRTPTPIPATPTPTPVVLTNVNMTNLVDPSCTDCFNISIVSNFLIDRGEELEMNVTFMRTVYSNSSEGQALISAYNITKIPTLLISKEANRTKLMEIWNSSGSVENDGTLVLREVYPPYVDLANNGTIVGKVEMIALGAPATCTTCYNVSMHNSWLIQRGVTITKHTDVPANSTEWRTLVTKYNVTAVPTIILSPELDAYPGMNDFWMGLIGPKANDGWYVFTNMTLLTNMTYYDLSRNTTVTLNNTEG